MRNAQRKSPVVQDLVGQDVIMTIATAALAIGACLYYGARVVLAIRDAGGDLRGKVEAASRVLYMHPDQR